MSWITKKIRDARSGWPDPRDFFQARRYRSDHSENAPIFIVGCGHSGTSILMALLGAHSRIHAIPQETYLAYSLKTKSPAIQKDARKKIRQFERATAIEGKKRWLEKTPSHIESIPQLLSLCPNARIIIMIRDGRDVACSIRDRTGTHPQVYRLKYEDLVENPREAITGVLQFLGENFEEQVLHHHEKPKHYYAQTLEKPENAFGENHVQYRNWQMNQPLFDGRGKWKNLTAEERRMIKQGEGAMLIEYGYAQDDNW
jgi:hypothetical protein